MNRIDQWTDEEIAYATENMGLKSYKEIGLDIGRSRSAVMVKMNRLGHKLDQKYEYDKDFFKEINTEEKSYWLGFISADGYVTYLPEIRQYALGIEIRLSDISHLEKFNKSIKGNCKISTRIRKPVRENSETFPESCSLRIYSKEMVEDIILKGVVCNKSLILKFPTLKDESMIRHFIRGYFDGNGSISIEKRSNQIRCNFTCASKEFLDKLKIILDKLNIHSYIAMSSKNSKAYQIGITGRNSTKTFLEYIYNDSNISLDRKHEFYFANIHLLEYIRKGWDK